MNRKKAALFLQTTVLDNPYIPWEPFQQQAKFLLLPHREALFGGAAGGGKTVTLLMAALQFVHIPGYNALILRKTFPMLTRADSPIPLSMQWLAGTDATYEDKNHRWTFPSGATLQFGHLHREQNKYDYQGAAFQFIAFDELTHFLKPEYTYLLSRLRRSIKLGKLPLRIRNSANPGGVGHQWVKDRFIPTEDYETGELTYKDRPFIPSNLSDNIHLDQVAYRASLMDMDPHERSQLLHGDWESIPPGDVISPDWIEYIDHSQVPRGMDLIRYYDLAGTELKGKAKKSKDPDWSACALMGEHRGCFYLLDVRRVRESPLNRDLWMRRNAKRDGDIVIWIEQDPGQAGKSQISNFKKDTLSEWEVHGNPKTQGKMIYWGMLASKMEAGLMKVVRAPWNAAWEEELTALTRNDSHAHDDMADATSGALKMLLSHSGGAATWELGEAEMEQLERENESEELSKDSYDSEHSKDSNEDDDYGLAFS